jgi:hypothetical protein
MDAIRSRVATFVALIALAAGLAGLLISGCGVSSASSGASQIWGDVTFNDKPVQDGVIIFMPANNSMSNWAAGAIRNGKYVVGVWQGNGPLEPGLYKIFFRFSQGGGKTGSPGVRSNGSEGEKGADYQAGPPSSETSPSPLDRFTNPDTSGLAVTVRKEPSRIDVRLKG